jgi:hypothetical protein
MIATKTNSITCPKCGQVIPLAEAMEAQMKSGLEDKLKAERERLQEEAKHTEERVRKEFQEREERANAEAEQRIKEMHAANAKVIQEAERMKANNENILAQKIRELETKEVQLKADAEKLQLENERTLREAQSRLEGEVRTKLETEAKLKEAENITLMASMTKQIDELKRKAENASQQLIGEAQEIALEEALRMAFPSDIVEPVQKGMSGADCILKIRTNGEILGTIVFECKRTKAWLGEWVNKLKDNQRTVNAELAILVSQAFPSDMKTKAGVYEGIWITDFHTAISLITALRAGLIYASTMKTLLNGSDEKSQKLFKYVTSPEFRGNMQAIIETFIAFEADLAAEKRAAEKQWKKRQATITRALTATNRIYGSLQGTLGDKALPDFETKQLDSGTPLT